jgi:hypothetical protein
MPTSPPERPHVIRDTTRRRLLGTGAGATSALAGCSTLEQSTDANPRQRTTPSGAKPSVFVTTDGTTVTATGPDGVIAEGGDAGAVVQTILDSFETRDAGMVKPYESGRPPATHVHFGRGIFPWGTQATSTGANGVRITGNWIGTRLSADATIDSFLDFQNPPERGGYRPGPKISHLQFHGHGKADHFVTYDGATDDTAVEHVTGFGTRKSMIYAKPTGDRENFDNARFRDLRLIYGGALAILEDGTGLPADIKFEHCACNFPDTYAIVLRNAVRVQIDRVYGGLGDEGKGVVLIENPPAEDFAGGEAGSKQCQLNMIEMEHHNADHQAAAVHVRVPEDTTTANHTHEVRFPRAAPPRPKSQFLKVDGAVNDGVRLARDITLTGTQLPLTHGEAIEITDAADCHVDVTPTSYRKQRGLAARNATTVENGARITFDGVGRNAGSPAEGGEWLGNGYDGITVVDTTDGGLYTHVDGAWWDLGSATRLSSSTAASVQPVLGIPRQSLAVDGDVGELDRDPAIHVPDDVSVYDDGGAESITLAGSFWFTYDDERLYVASDLEDDVHQNTATDSTIFKGDSIQVGVGPAGAGRFSGFTEITYGLLEDGPASSVRTHNVDREVPDDPDGLEVAVERDESRSRTVAELAVPWSILRVSPDDEAIGINVALVDADGDGTAFLQWAPGIFGGKSAGEFPIVGLE